VPYPTSALLEGFEIDRDGKEYPDSVEQTWKGLYALLLAFVSMFSQLVFAIYRGHPPRPSRLILSPDIGYAERQAEALSPRYGCQAARLLASIAAEDNVHG
jgi:hypothetical protein